MSEQAAAMNTKAANLADRAARAKAHAERVATQYPGTPVAAHAAERAERAADHAARVASQAARL